MPEMTELTVERQWKEGKVRSKIRKFWVSHHDEEPTSRTEVLTERSKNCMKIRERTQGAKAIAIVNLSCSTYHEASAAASPTPVFCRIVFVATTAEMITPPVVSEMTSA